MPKKGKVTVLKDRCKSCGICIQYCPKKVLDFDETGKCSVVAADECIACDLCVLRCPDFAIEVEVVK